MKELFMASSWTEILQWNCKYFFNKKKRKLVYGDSLCYFKISPQVNCRQDMVSAYWLRGWVGYKGPLFKKEKEVLSKLESFSTITKHYKGYVT